MFFIGMVFFYGIIKVYDGGVYDCDLFYIILFDVIFGKKND